MIGMLENVGMFFFLFSSFSGMFGLFGDIVGKLGDKRQIEALLESQRVFAGLYEKRTGKV